jgi:hypothetical protein
MLLAQYNELDAFVEMPQPARVPDGSWRREASKLWFLQNKLYKHKSKKVFPSLAVGVSSNLPLLSKAK